MTRDEALAHGAEIAAATSLPVSADLENAFADEPAGVAETIRLAAAAGLAGCSVEDYTGREDQPIYDLGLARDRIAAAAEAAKGTPGPLVLTARAENYLHGRPDLADTISRLQAYQEAGADVLYAPGLTSLDDIRAVVREVDRPVNVLALAGGPDRPRAGRGRRPPGLGRRRVRAAPRYGAAVQAARELREQGSYGFLELAADGRAAARDARSPGRAEPAPARRRVSRPG